MASFLQIENISKSYGPKILFENIAFNINEGDKYALIAPNGTGKTSLLRIIAGKDKSDSGGKILFLRHIKIAFLEQEYDYDPDESIFGQILKNSGHTEHADIDAAMTFYDYEQKVKEILTDLGLTDFDKKMKDLSGGEVKRVALTEMLASQADLYIMDEPTNHLDIEAIEYLESFFTRFRCTLLMVTHDRYFLDRVCNVVMEMDRGQIYVYRGDYQNYLEKRQERIENYNAETDKVKNILRRELEWMRSTPQARTGKAKYRIDAFYDLKDRSEQVYDSKSVDMSNLQSRTHLGSKIIDCKDLSFWYGDQCYLSHFTYNFQRYEKVGIVGKNGVGKTTFINLLTGEHQDSSGRQMGILERGESVKIGYYHQSGMQFDEEQTVLETLNDTGLLSRFLFPHDMLNNKISKLSGGEKRRLYLLTILVKQPNLLILDEPTNDLDIVTLDILEEYLQEFKGTLLIVTHDRHFLDRLVDHLLVFCGDGVVKDFLGDYSDYRAYLKDYAKAAKQAQTSAKQIDAPQAPAQKRDKPKRLTFNEQRELEQLEKDLKTLNEEKVLLESKMNGSTIPYDELEKITSRFAEVSSLIDKKETRWLELSMSV
ncbi:MAG: ABC-F family ATP-binding cassette domain-containing protein [Bacteroidales bacterium]